MNRLRKFRFVLAAIVIGLSAHLTDLTVSASCAVPPAPQRLGDQLRAAPVVFVGTVLFTWDNKRSARVKVESIWNGPALPTYVDIHGEAPGSGPFSGSSADRQYTTGLRYLFVPINRSSPLQDWDECSSLTQEYSADVAVYAPPGVRAPHPATPLEDAQNFADRYQPLPQLAAVILVAIGLWLLLRRQRRSVI